MLHTKFQGYQKKVFLRFFIKYGHGGQLGFSFPHPMETPYEIWLQLAHSFLRRCLKSVDDRQMMDGKTTEAYLSYKLTTEPSAGELKKKKKDILRFFKNIIVTRTVIIVQESEAINDPWNRIFDGLSIMSAT